MKIISRVLRVVLAQRVAATMLPSPSVSPPPSLFPLSLFNAPEFELLGKAPGKRWVHVVQTGCEMLHSHVYLIKPSLH